MVKRLSRRSRLGLKLLLAAILSAVLVLTVDLRSTFNHFGRIAPAHAIAALLLSLIIRWVLSLQLYVAMQTHNARYPIWKLLSITMRTQFFGLILPGDASNMGLKWYLLGRIHGQRAQAFVTLIYLRLVAVCVIFGSGTLAFVISVPGLPHAWLWTAVGLNLLLVSSIVMLHAGFVSRVLRWLTGTRQWMLLPLRLREIGRKLIEASDVLAMMSRFSLTGIWLLQLAIKLLAALLCWVVGLGLGIQLPPQAYLWLHSALELAEWVPLTPSGLGTRELTLVYLMGVVGVAAEAALAFSLALFAIRVLTGLCGGLFLIGGRHQDGEPELAGNSDYTPPQS